MNICVAGKNNIAVDVLEYLLKNNKARYNLWVICNEKRRELKGFQKSLAEYARKNKVPEIKLAEAYELSDLVFLSMEFDLIVNPYKFKDARLYNVHFSYLPSYKGMYTSAVPILNNEKYSGVTFHKIDQGIDTGDIISREKIEINAKDTCRDLYLKYLKTGAELVISHLEEVILSQEKTFPQEAEGASYYPRSYIDYSKKEINIIDVAVSVERQIRAFSFREYQMPQFNGTPIIACEITGEKATEKPGTIMKEDRSALWVASVDFVVKLFKDRFEEMFEACQSGNLPCVKEICICNEHVNIVNHYGWTPLIVATYNNHLEIAQYLISMGANVHVKNYNGTNLLMYAKEAYRIYHDRRLWDMFLELGLNLYDKDNYGLTVLDYIDRENIEALL